MNTVTVMMKTALATITTKNKKIAEQNVYKQKAVLIDCFFAVLNSCKSDYFCEIFDGEISKITIAIGYIISYNIGVAV